MNEKRAYQIAAKAIRERRREFAFGKFAYEHSKEPPEFAARDRRIYDELSEALAFFEPKKIR